MVAVSDDPEVTPPYVDNFVEMPLSKPVNMVQLAAEVTEATGTAVALSLVGPSVATDPVSEDNPATLYASPAVDADQLAQAVAEHVPNPTWGPTPADQAFNDIWGKLQANPGHKMSAAEQRALIVGLVFKFMSGPV